MNRIVKVCQILAIIYYLLLITGIECQTPNANDVDKLIGEIFDIPSDGAGNRHQQGGDTDEPYPVTPPSNNNVQPETNYPHPTNQPPEQQTPPPAVHPPTEYKPPPPSEPQPQPSQPYPPPPPPTGHPTGPYPKPSDIPVTSTNTDENEPNPCPVGECVPYYLCANGSIITSGEGILDVRFGEEDNPDPTFHPCKGLFQTCCSLKLDTPNIPKIDRKDGCGYRNHEGVGFRITGEKDNEAQYGEFPWMVAIIKEEPSLQDVLNVYQCGGSLIHPSVVLTAAHCVYGKPPQTLKIRAGEWDTQTRDELFPHQDRGVSEIVIHENYYKGGLFNDIALLLLREPVELSEIVNTACLPPQDYNFDGTRCFASGWGKDVWGKEGKYQVILKKIDLPIVPRQPCQEKLRRTRLGQHFNLHASFVCAGGEPGKDTCKGDGGSPLVCPIPGERERFFQSGIVSWGIGCGGLNPGVYASVARFRTWIDEQFQYKALDTSFYSK